jgi:hypothetical protein
MLGFRPSGTAPISAILSAETLGQFSIFFSGRSSFTMTPYEPLKAFVQSPNVKKIYAIELRFRAVVR